MSVPDARPLAGILLFDGVEVLDWAGPYEVLSAAQDPEGRPWFRALTLAPAARVTCAGGVRVLADRLLDEAPPPDILVVPGGPGARDPAGQEPLIDLTRRAFAGGSLVASVCTGSFILARAGLLDGVTATTHPARLDSFAAAFPAVNAVRAKIVDHGRLMTAGGVSSGVDLALHLLERFHGPEARRREAARLDGPWS